MTAPHPNDSFRQRQRRRVRQYPRPEFAGFDRYNSYAAARRAEAAAARAERSRDQAARAQQETARRAMHARRAAYDEQVRRDERDYQPVPNGYVAMAPAVAMQLGITGVLAGSAAALAAHELHPEDAGYDSDSLMGSDINSNELESVSSADRGDEPELLEPTTPPNGYEVTPIIDDPQPVQGIDADAGHDVEGFGLSPESDLGAATDGAGL